MNTTQGNRRDASGSGLRLILLPALLLWAVLCGSASANPQETKKADFDYENQPLRVGVWLDREQDEVYRRGEEIAAGMQTNEDSYAVVYRIDADGYVTILWPRSRYDDGFVFGGHEYDLPVSGAPRLRVSEDEGLGYVEAIVSRYPFDLRELEIDFHHEQRRETYDFRVAGDPFLAMNEVNFAVTGLEDAGDFVVTNYASYYVHEKVDHPRYLCSQCHVDENVAYDPYNDHCTLEISVDYGWSNSWYGRYGYFPTYYQPAYVYVDPWTWRPWVNFWYYPSYVCPPYPYYNWGYSAYAWYDSPYYRGDSYYWYDEGVRRHRPLAKDPSRLPLTKSREYTRVSPIMAKAAPDARARASMETRTALPRTAVTKPGIAGDLAPRAKTSPVVGEKPMTRKRPDLGKVTRSQARPGLRVRDTRDSASPLRPAVRHTAGGTGKKPTMNPVRRTTHDVRGGNIGTSIRGERPVPDRKGTVNPRTKGSQGTIKPVEPRKKGTRVWNRGTSGSTGSRDAVRTKTPRTSSKPKAPPASSRSRTVRPKPSRKSSDSGKVPSSTPRATTKSRSNKSNSNDSGGSTPSRSKGSSQSKSRSGSSKKSRSR